ncbi:MAG: hypothetical protein J5645_08580 [Lachnospiraceae bacterium]|nr:hypothetical protein [Lachnospiraceae bacterium]
MEENQPKPKRNRKRLIIAGIIVLLLVLLTPIPSHYKDGGSYEYNAILYSVYRCHSRYTAKETDGWYNYEGSGTKITILGFTVYDSVEHRATTRTRSPFGDDEPTPTGTPECTPTVAPTNTPTGTPTVTPTPTPDTRAAAPTIPAEYSQEGLKNKIDQSIASSETYAYKETKEFSEVIEFTPRRGDLQEYDRTVLYLDSEFNVLKQQFYIDKTITEVVDYTPYGVRNTYPDSVMYSFAEKLYDDDGRLVFECPYNDTITLYLYDENGRLSSKTTYEKDLFQSKLQYQYDEKGNLSSVNLFRGKYQDHISGLTVRYESDADGRLICVRVFAGRANSDRKQINEIRFHYFADGAVMAYQEGYQTIFLPGTALKQSLLTTTGLGPVFDFERCLDDPTSDAHGDMTYPNDPYHNPEATRALGVPTHSPGCFADTNNSDLKDSVNMGPRFCPEDMTRILCHAYLDQAEADLLRATGDYRKIYEGYESDLTYDRIWTTYQYANNLLMETTYRGCPDTYTYDSAGRLIRLNDQGLEFFGEEVTFKYDGNGRLKQRDYVVQAVGASGVQYIHTETEENVPYYPKTTETYRYEYNSAGKLTRMTGDIHTELIEYSITNTTTGIVVPVTGTILLTEYEGPYVYRGEYNYSAPRESYSNLDKDTFAYDRKILYYDADYTLTRVRYYLGEKELLYVDYNDFGSFERSPDSDKYVFDKYVYSPPSEGSVDYACHFDNNRNVTWSEKNGILSCSYTADEQGRLGSYTIIGKTGKKYIVNVRYYSDGNVVFYYIPPEPDDTDDAEDEEYSACVFQPDDDLRKNLLGMSNLNLIDSVDLYEDDDNAYFGFRNFCIMTKSAEGNLECGLPLRPSLPAGSRLLWLGGLTKAEITAEKWVCPIDENTGSPAPYRSCQELYRYENGRMIYNQYNSGGGGGGSSRYEYDSQGRLAAYESGGDMGYHVKDSYTYNSAGKVKACTHYDQNYHGEGYFYNDAKYSYSYDGNGRLASATAEGTVRKTYSYDDRPEEKTTYTFRLARNTEGK